MGRLYRATDFYTRILNTFLDGEKWFTLTLLEMLKRSLWLIYGQAKIIHGSVLSSKMQYIHLVQIVHLLMPARMCRIPVWIAGVISQVVGIVCGPGGSQYVPSPWNPLVSSGSLPILIKFWIMESVITHLSFGVREW